MGVMKLGAMLALTLVMDPAYDLPAERLYGRVLTAEGGMLEGYLRWDRNEVAWTDFLEGAKEIPSDFLREAEALDPEYAALRRRERSIVAFGVRIMWDEDDDDDPVTSAASVRFGQLESLIRLDGRRALLRLKSGVEVRLSRTSTDLGRSMRGLIVEDAERGEVELGWSELDRIDFMAAPPGVPPPRSERIHGTVKTWSGMELTGYIAWDRDEIFTSDILDGRQEGDDRAIPFGDVVAIEWESSRSSRIVLAGGEELVLRGTNDVDRNNRGIEVSDAGFGRAIVPWVEFESVAFHPPKGESRPFGSFDGGPMLYGTVEALDGRTLSGELRWDNDETSEWETLDGWYGGVDFDIEFGSIHSIRRNGGKGVTVTLLDGRTFDLEGSNDVDDGNRGIFVKPDGRARRLVRWKDFDRVVFSR
jgi:hypothetical protein